MEIKRNSDKNFSLEKCEHFYKLMELLYKLNEHDRRKVADVDAFFSWLGPIENGLINKPEVKVEPKQEQAYSNLPWEASEGKRIGQYERVCKRACQNNDLFRHLFQVLEVNGALISKPLKIGTRHYWIYLDCIYRRASRK